LGHYQHNGEIEMKNRCKEFGELSLANRLAGCVNIDINCAALRARGVRKGNGAATIKKEVADESEKLTF